jgi:hypothetical protein
VCDTTEFAAFLRSLWRTNALNHLNLCTFLFSFGSAYHGGSNFLYKCF